MPSRLIDEAITTFQSQKRLAEKAIVQLTDEQLGTALDADTNSVAVIMKHVAGNMVSRWTDFLTTDGEKPDRHRDGEFIDVSVAIRGDRVLGGRLGVPVSHAGHVDR